MASAAQPKDTDEAVAAILACWREDGLPPVVTEAHAAALMESGGHTNHRYDRHDHVTTVPLAAAARNLARRA